MSETRHGLAAAVQVTQANGTAELSGAAQMLKGISAAQHFTSADDQGFNTPSHVREVRKTDAAPHLEQNVEPSASSGIDGITTRNAACVLGITALLLSSSRVAVSPTADYGGGVDARYAACHQSDGAGTPSLFP